MTQLGPRVRRADPAGGASPTTWQWDGLSVARDAIDSVHCSTDGGDAEYSSRPCDALARFRAGELLLAGSFVAHMSKDPASRLGIHGKRPSAGLNTTRPCDRRLLDLDSGALSVRLPNADGPRARGGGLLRSRDFRTRRSVAGQDAVHGEGMTYDVLADCGEGFSCVPRSGGNTQSLGHRRRSWAFGSVP